MGTTLTVYACIGNSDDKLTQARWSAFHRIFVALIRDHASMIYGEWTSAAASPWQNACVAFEIDSDEGPTLRRLLGTLAGEYDQDSIAWAEAKTVFLEPDTTPAPQTIADDVLDYCRAHPWDGEHLTYGDLVLQHDHDGTFSVLEASDVFLVATELLASEQLTNVSFVDGILTIDAKPEPLRYRPLYTTDAGYRVLFQREGPC